MLQGMAGRRERHDGRVRGVRCVVYLVGLCVMLLAVAGAAEAGDWQRMPSRSPEPYDHVVSDARGNTVAVWSGQDLSGQNTFVRAAFRLAGGSWGPAEVLQATSTYGTSLSEVRVAMSPEGLAVATWVRRDSADSTPETDEVWAAVKPVGGASFGAPTKLSVPGDPPGATQPVVAVGAHGDAMVVWSTGDARCSIDCRGIRAATRPSDGSFQQLGTLSPTGERAEQPRVALDAGGRATVVWRTFAAPGQQVLYTAQRGATGPFDAPQIAATCDCAVGGPQLAVDRDGTAHLVIRASAGAVLWTTRPWGKSFQALREIAPSSAAAEPAVSVAPDGTALVVLARTERILEWRARPPGGDFGRAYYLDRTYFGQTEPSHADHLSVPTLAVSDGQTVATWTPLPHWESSLGRYVLNDAAVRVARYDSTAPDPNLIQNDGFETGLWEWNASGSGAGTVMSREEGGHSGGWAARLANTGTSPASCVLNDAPVPIAPGSDYLQTGSGVFTLGLWVRADAAGQTLRLRLREYSSGALAGSKSTTVTLSTAWQKASFTYTPAAPGALHPRRRRLRLRRRARNLLHGRRRFADVRANPCRAARTAAAGPGAGGQCRVRGRPGGLEHVRKRAGDLARPRGRRAFRRPGRQRGQQRHNRRHVRAQRRTEHRRDHRTRSLHGRAMGPRRDGGKDAAAAPARVRQDHPIAAGWPEHAGRAHDLLAEGHRLLRAQRPRGLGPGSQRLRHGRCFRQLLRRRRRRRVARPRRSGARPGAQPRLRVRPLALEHLRQRGRRHRVARAGRTLRRLDSQAGQHCDNRGNLRAQRRAQRREHHGERHLHHTMWVRAATAGPTLKLKVREYQGTTLVGSDTTPISLTTAWQQVAVTHTPIAPGNSTLDLTAYISGAAPGTCFLVDDISIRHS
jgi:hypothetical protein